jgi:anti-sigma factor RsiW
VNIDCSQLADLVFDFVAGDLPDDRRELLEAHLEACPPCTVHVQTYRVTITLSRKLPCRALPPEVEQRLRDVLARECGQ